MAGPDTLLTVPPAAGRFVLVAAVAAASPYFRPICSAAGQVRRAFADPQAIAAYPIPPAFFLLLIPLDLVVPGGTGAALAGPVPAAFRAILASAACSRRSTPTWPSPVPLLVLAVGLGYCTCGRAALSARWWSTDVQRGVGGVSAVGRAGVISVGWTSGLSNSTPGGDRLDRRRSVPTDPHQGFKSWSNVFTRT